MLTDSKELILFAFLNIYYLYQGNVGGFPTFTKHLPQKPDRFAKLCVGICVAPGKTNATQQQPEDSATCSTCNGMLTQLSLHALSNMHVQLHFSSHLGQTRSRAAA